MSPKYDNQITDAEYIRLIQDKNVLVTEEFFHSARHYFKKVSSKDFGRTNIIDDVFQQAFVKLWIEIENKRIFTDSAGNIYRHATNGDIKKLNCSLKTFLTEIARNEYRSWVRNDKFYLDHDIENSTEIMVDADPEVSERENVRAQLEQIVSSCILELPSRCKEILTMYYYRQMSLDEIIEARKEKNTSKNGLKTSKYKCMQALKEKISKRLQLFKIKI